MNVAVFDELIEAKPAGVALVAESGLKSASDLARLRWLGYDAFLMGERFMTEAHPGAALRSVLVAAGEEGRSR
jgi:indole-3-glycerol phosphate synthase